MKENTFILPLARSENLVTKDLAEELLIYDLDNHKAYCLNKTASLIFLQCDGKTSFNKATETLKQHLDTPVTDEIIRYALDELNQINLIKRGSFENSLKTSRRKIVSMALALGFTLPIISTLVVPTAAQSASCAGVEAPCVPNGSPACCTNQGLICINTESGPTGSTCEVSA